jgi:hypothetical protein
VVPYFIYLKHASTVQPAALQACGVSRADADRVLKARLPQAVLVEKSEEAAQLAIAGLRAKGVEAFTVTPPQLHGFAPVRCKTWPPPIDDVKMIILGKIHRESRSVTSSNIDPLAGSAIGYGAAGMPLSIRGTDRESVSVSKDHEGFCCLIADLGKAVALMESGFDYRGALDRVELTREKSFLKVVAKARDAWPTARFDDRLFRFPASVRLLGHGATVSAGPLLTVAKQTQAGSTEDRAWATAMLLFLEAM